MITSRLNRIQESPTLKLTKTAEDLKAKGMKIYNFGIGEPDFTTPERIIEKAFEWAKKGKTHYTPANGIMELRQAIAQKMHRKNSIMAGPENVLVSPSKYAIYLAMYVLLEDGDGVILPDPYYSSYSDMIKLAGGKPLYSPLEKDYSFNFQEMQKLISPRTKIILFNNPSNPTGRVYTEKEIRELVDFSIKNKLTIVSDEIYEDLIYEGKMFSPGSIEELRDNVLTVSGFSKSYAMTGWRIGYLVGSEEVIKAATKVQGQTITCVSSISQYAALEALKDDADPASFRETFRKRRDYVFKRLSEIPGHSIIRPSGAFYAFPKYNYSMNSADFSSQLLQRQNVIVTPGTAFGTEGEYHYRLSFATSDEILDEGISRIEKFSRELK